MPSGQFRYVSAGGPCPAEELRASALGSGDSVSRGSGRWLCDFTLRKRRGSVIDSVVPAAPWDGAEEALPQPAARHAGLCSDHSGGAGPTAVFLAVGDVGPTEHPQFQTA